MYALPLSRAGDLDADSAESAVLFDGAAKYQAKTATPSPAGGNKEQLAAELKKRITFDDHGNPAERAALDSMISRMMDSPTAREIAAKFINENAKVEISFEEMPESIVATVDGKKTIWGRRAYTQYTEPTRVVLNKFYMQYDKDLGTGMLAHEMLGHTLERHRGGAALRDVQYYNANEEENARLVGWLVATELNVKPEDEIWAYTQDPDANMEAIKTWAVDYALTLTSEEMKDPVTVYKRRLAGADKEAEQLSKERYGEWDKMADHFVSEHKMDPASFQTVKNVLSNAIKDLPRRQKLAMAIKDKLQGLLNSFSSDEGKAFLRRLSKESEDDYFKQKDAAILEWRKRLSSLLVGKTPGTSPEASSPPPPVGQITWEQLRELIEKDESSCPFGGIK